MRKQDIEIVINEKGEVTFEVKGVKGGSCVDETKFLEDALGNTIESRELTDEYYEQPQTVNQTNKTR